jgi:uncharacterized phage-like protein YoqJ
MADTITMVSEDDYQPRCMEQRNEFMVDNSNLVIAYFKGHGGGTKKTLAYAKQKGRAVWYIK